MTIREVTVKVNKRHIQFDDPEIGFVGHCAVDENGERNINDPFDDRDSYDLDAEALSYRISKLSDDLVYIDIDWSGQ